MSQKPNQRTKFLNKFFEVLQEIGTSFKYEFLDQMPSYKGFGGGKQWKKQWYYGLKNLERRKIIRRGIDRKYLFTDYGKRWYQKSFSRYTKLATIKRFSTIWDKKWRIIIFDIPEEFHQKRAGFVRKLKNLGFYALQKSVFVFPYPCENELGDLANKLNISDYVDIIVAENVGFKMPEIKKFFHIY